MFKPPIFGEPELVHKIPEYRSPTPHIISAPHIISEFRPEQRPSTLHIISEPTPRPSWHLPEIPLHEKTVNEILKEVKEVEKHGEIPIAVSPTRVIETSRPQHAAPSHTAPSHLALHEEGKPSNTVKPLQEVPTHEGSKTALHAEALPAHAHVPAHVHAEVASREQRQPQYLWVGWRVSPEMEKYVREFTEVFEHGRHVGHPPIMLPMLGGVLAPTPGAPTAPAPGAPVAIAPPQGAGNQRGVAVSLP